jgi:Fe-Mn family superoxide dismutase
MTTLSRRSFLFASSGAAAGTFVSTGLVAAGSNSAAESGLVTGLPRPMRYQSIPGFLSAGQINPHYRAHYGGALRGYNAADAELEPSLIDGTSIRAEAYGAMQRSRSSKGNSVLLHELYFDGMTANSTGPAAKLKAAIKQRFGSLDKWSADFQTCAKSAAGWALLIRHQVNGKLYNVICDEHASGPLWMASPLVVIDVYEHAFYVDYLNQKAQYIEKFMHHIDWDEASRRHGAAICNSPCSR